MSSSAGITGAASASWSIDRTRATLKAIVERATRLGWDAERIHAEFVEFMLSDGGRPHLEAVIRYYSVNTYRALVQAKDRAVALDERMTAADASLRVEREQRVEGAVQALKAEIRSKLMDAIQPNGKALGDCTGAELIWFEGWFRRLAGRMRPNQIVRDRFTEAELRAAYVKRRTA